MTISPRLKKILLSSAALLMLCGIGSTVAHFHAQAKRSHSERMITRNQRKPALANYKAKFSYVHNRDLYRPTYKYDRDNTLKTPVNYWKGNPKYSFKPYYQFNINTDPQSMAILPHDQMYVLYSDEDGYDNIVRTNVHNNINKPVGTIAQDFGKVGPAAHLGHGQTLSYNPHDHTLWMLTNSKGGYKKYSSAVQINRRTLKPEYQVKFKFSNSLKIGAALAFDKEGRAYTCVKTFGGNARKNSLKIFRGNVNRHGVHFHLYRQLILHAPGHVLQDMSYNPRNDRVYIITDGAIMSFPANRLGRLTPREVHDTIFKGNREFEDVGFLGNRGYLLANSPEVVEKSNAHL